MESVIKIKKGLDISIQGSAAREVADALDISTYAVCPDDYVGFEPRLLKAEGDAVAAGEALMSHKGDPRLRLCSPVSGTVRAIVRGAKRHIEAVVVETDGDQTSPAGDPISDSTSRQVIVDAMLQNGLWAMLRQRPFGTMANPDLKPKGVFVSCFDSAPLAPDYDFVLQGRDDDFAAGLRLLARLAEAPVHLGFRPRQRLASLPLPDGCKAHHFDGPHPAGNVGTQIARIDPINKGDTVWTVNLQDAAILGHWARTGQYRPEKVVAFAGPTAAHPQYYRLIAGACIQPLTTQQHDADTLPRIRHISGNILSGTQIAPSGFLHAHDNMISVLPEGSYHEFMGWLRPGLLKFSASRTFLSGFLPASAARRSDKSALGALQRHLRFDTNLHGGVRPLVFGEQWEHLFPFDIYPTQLVKAAAIGDIELMERLGILELEPEDLALCEFADTSKTELQALIRQGLELIRLSSL
ncbi:MAG: Na(+)-translocating NADH-quinone reductase subunit A [Bacteroidales bacterium]|nr:Na(+)-translocating NADH-quinone reductase subunit A [Bacteroidales bacterium]